MSLILELCSKANICGIEYIAKEVREEWLESRAVRYFTAQARMQNVSKYVCTVQLSVWFPTKT